jgi:hypothetical protein
MTRPPRRRALLVALGLTLVAAGACEDPFKLEADRETDPLAFAVWALNGSPDEFPSALNVPGVGLQGSTLVRPEASGNFDIAFDIDVDGKLLVIPMRLVVTPLLGARAVHFIEVPATFEQILSAPATGWENDSTIVLDVGEVFMVRVFAAECQFQIRQYIYAKFVVDSILPAERRARLRGRLNPNCGFRSFLEGIPEF